MKGCRMEDLGGVIGIWEVGMTGSRKAVVSVQMKQVSRVLRKDGTALWRGEWVVNRVVWLTA